MGNGNLQDDKGAVVIRGEKIAHINRKELAALVKSESSLSVLRGLMPGQPF